MPDIIEVQQQAARIREAFSNMPYMGGNVDTRALNVSGHDAGDTATAALAILKATAEHTEKLCRILGHRVQLNRQRDEQLEAYKKAVGGIVGLVKLIKQQEEQGAHHD